MRLETAPARRQGCEAADNYRFDISFMLNLHAETFRLNFYTTGVPDCHGGLGRGAPLLVLPELPYSSNIYLQWAGGRVYPLAKFPRGGGRVTTNRPGDGKSGSRRK